MFVANYIESLPGGQVDSIWSMGQAMALQATEKERKREKEKEIKRSSKCPFYSIDLSTIF